jgi:hypothetical protein
MRTILILIFLAIMYGFSYASPYLVSDNSTEAAIDSCTIDGDGFTIPCAINPHKGIKVDCASLTRGRSYTVTAKYCSQGGIWCSDPSLPFTFTAPLTPKPLNIQLSK